MQNKQEINEILKQIKQYEAEFIQVIRERLGIIIHSHQVNDLHRTLIKGCGKFDVTVENYLTKLRQCASDSPLLENLVYGITVGETYFFRDKHQIELLEKNLLPTLIKKKRALGDHLLRIWSAACSSGEEIYTVMMLLHKMLPDFNKWTFHLMGTDINTNSLKKAIKGIYGEWSMRSIPDMYRNKYFSRVKNNYYLSEIIREPVNFSYLNLNEESYPSMFNGTNAQDLILCCNVLIYFDNDMIAGVMKRFENCLVPEGYILLGASDPVAIKGTHLKFHHEEGVYYQKVVDNFIEEPKKEPVVKKRFVVERSKKIIKVPKPVEDIPPVIVNHSQINQLIKESKWQEVLEILNHVPEKERQSLFVLNTKATVLANLGELEKALSYCEQALQVDPTHKHSYFIYALILIELNQLDLAEAILRRVIFLDHQFVEGHFQLGLLLLRKNKKSLGVKSLQNALMIANKHNPQELVSEMAGLDFGRLADILRHEIDMYLATQEIKHE